MNEEAKKLLAEITAKDLSEITEGEAAILKARSAYLSEDELVKFAEILEEEPKAPKAPKEPKAPKA